ncbi:MAG: FAD-binding protein [Gammaproteobacteria bacterium]|nr:FAD-binding protein [Gammaproteobacteria bacterium]
MNILVVAEHDNIEIKSASLAAINAAVKLGSNQVNNNIDLLLAGNFSQENKTAMVNSFKELKVINNILVAQGSIYEHSLAEDFTDLIVDTVNKNHTTYEYIILPATTFGKNIAPRVAALLDINPLSDVIEIVDPVTFKRPIYAGNAIATVRLHDKIKLFTVRSTCFNNNLINTDNVNNNINTEILELDVTKYTSKNLSKFVKYELSSSERPELGVAKIVVSGGRGLGSQENFKLINDLADKLNAAVGASRAAVDAGYVSNDYQVGQTGKVVAPDLYFAIGISGAIQHIAGIRESKVIVAINKDEEAPIFKIADYGLTGDLFKILPELTEKISQLKKA